MTVRPPDVEAHVRSTLLPLSVPVSTRVPNPRPVKFIRISVVGGARANLVQGQPFVIVECWASDPLDASDLASRAWGVLEAAYGPGLAASMPAWFPDPESAQARYQFTIQPFINLQEAS